MKTELVDKVHIEIGVSDHFAGRTAEAVVSPARAGEVGDGKVFVLRLEEVVRIRTGKENTATVTPPENVPVAVESRLEADCVPLCDGSN